MTTQTESDNLKVTIFTVYDAEGEGSPDDFHQYLFTTEQKALEECAGFMKQMLDDGIMFSDDERAKLFSPLTLALAREDIRAAMDVFNDNENQNVLRVRVETLEVK